MKFRQKSTGIFMKKIKAKKNLLEDLFMKILLEIHEISCENNFFVNFINIFFVHEIPCGNNPNFRGQTLNEKKKFKKICTRNSV